MTYPKNWRFILVLFVIVSSFFIRNNQIVINAQEKELVNELTIPVDCETLTEALARVAENGTIFLEERTKLVVTSRIEISKNVSVIGKGLLKSTVEFKDAGAIRIKIDDPDALRIKSAEVGSNAAVKFPETEFNSETNVIFRNINFEREGNLTKTVDDEYARLVQKRNVLIEHGVDLSILNDQDSEQIVNEYVNYQAEARNFLTSIGGSNEAIDPTEKIDYLMSIESGHVNVKDCTVSNPNRNGTGIMVFGSESNLVVENSIFGNNYAGSIFVIDSKISARYCIFSKSLSAAIHSEHSKIFLYFCKIKDSGFYGVGAIDDSVVGLVETEVSGSIFSGISCSNGTSIYLSGGEINNTTVSIDANLYCGFFVEDIRLSDAFINVSLSRHCNFQAARSIFSDSGFILDCKRHCIVSFENTVDIHMKNLKGGALGSGSLFHRSDEIDSPPVLTLLEEAFSH